MNQIPDPCVAAGVATQGGTKHSKGKLAAFLLAAFVLIAILSACGSDNASQSTGTGAQAPAFTLSDQSGQTYNFTPGDGKDHVLVFYMGYF